MAVLEILFLLVAIACGIGGLVCFILVVVQMFKNEETTLGIVCIILAFCTGIGYLIAFVYGWIKATEWDLKKVMMAWSGLFAAYLISIVLYYIVFVGVAAAGAAGEYQMQMENMPVEELNVEDLGIEIE